MLAMQYIFRFIYWLLLVVLRWHHHKIHEHLNSEVKYFINLNCELYGILTDDFLRSISNWKMIRALALRAGQTMYVIITKKLFLGKFRMIRYKIFQKLTLMSLITVSIGTAIYFFKKILPIRTCTLINFWILRPT